MAHIPAAVISIKEQVNCDNRIGWSGQKTLDTFAAKIPRIFDPKCFVPIWNILHVHLTKQLPNRKKF